METVKRVCREAGLGKVKVGHGGTLDPLASGVLRAEGTIVHPGSRVATAEAKLLDADGTLFAHASSSWLIQAAARKEKKEPIAA